MAFRDSPFRDIKVPLTWTAAGAVIVCLVIAIGFVMADRRGAPDGENYGQVKAVADAIHRPISGAIAAPVRWVQDGASYIGGYFFAVSDNRRLRAENKSLRQSYDQMIALRDLNERYVALLGLKTDPPMDMATGRAVTDVRGPFANARLINVGQEAGLAVGNPVMSENGLVGRITGVTTGASRVLLLTDVASRAPVMIDRTNARAILTGDGGPNPKLAFLRPLDGAKPGDRVVTSGDGGVIPRGLPVGVAVKGADGSWRVNLSADQTRIDFVRILKFKSFVQLINTEDLSKPVMPSEMGGLPAPAPPPKPAVPAPAGAGRAGAGRAAIPPAPSPKAGPTTPSVRPPAPLAKAPTAPQPVQAP